MMTRLTSVSALALALVLSTPALAQDPLEQARERLQAQQGGGQEGRGPRGARGGDRGGDGGEDRGRGEDRGPRSDGGPRGGDAQPPNPFERAREVQAQQQQAEERQRGADRGRDDRGRDRDRDRDRGRDGVDPFEQARRQIEDQQRGEDRGRDRDRWDDRWEDRRDRDVADAWRRVERQPDGREVIYLLRDPRYGYIDGCPPGLAWRDNGCLPPGQARRIAREQERRAREDWWWSTRNDDWRYYNGYAYREEPRDNGLAAVFIPLLAGALGIDNVWPTSYAYEPAPRYYSSYYRLDDRRDYRYADGVIYGLDRRTNRIETVSALLVGDPWTVGQRMPTGYDVYNVPYDYRGRYRDRDDRWYRYSDGYVYEVDPTTRLVQSVIQLVT